MPARLPDFILVKMANPRRETFFAPLRLEESLLRTWISPECPITNLRSSRGIAQWSRCSIRCWRGEGGSLEAKSQILGSWMRQKRTRPACAERRSVTKRRDLVDLVRCPKPLPFVAVAEDVERCPIGG